MVSAANIILGIYTAVPRNQWFGAGSHLAANNHDVLQLPVVELPPGRQGGEAGGVRGSEEQPHGGSTRSSKGVRRCVPTKSRGSWGKALGRLTVCWKRVRRGGWGVGSLATLEEQGIEGGRRKEADLVREEALGRSKPRARRHTALSLNLFLLNFMVVRTPNPRPTPS